MTGQSHEALSSYFAPAGEKRAKSTATDENQNEAITTNLENPSESGIVGQKNNESSGSAGVPAPRKFQQPWSDTKYKEWTITLCLSFDLLLI